MDKKKLRAFRIKESLDQKIVDLASERKTTYTDQLILIIKSYFDKNWYKKIFK